MKKTLSVYTFLMILLPGETQEKVYTGNLKISRKHVFTRSLPASFVGEGGGQGVLDGWSGGVGWGRTGGGGGFGLVRHEVAGEGVVVERGGLGVGLRRGCTFRFWQYCIP